MSIPDNEDKIRQAYHASLGAIPGPVDVRFALYRMAGRTEIFDIERARSSALTPVACDPATVQLVQYALCGAIHSGDGAAIHASAAVSAGATLDQLLDTAQAVLVVCGVPSYNVCCVAAAAAVGLSPEHESEVGE